MVGLALERDRQDRVLAHSPHVRQEIRARGDATAPIPSDLVSLAEARQARTPEEAVGHGEGFGVVEDSPVTVQPAQEMVRVSIDRAIGLARPARVTGRNHDVEAILECQHARSKGNVVGSEIGDELRPRSHLLDRARVRVGQDALSPVSLRTRAPSRPPATTGERV